MEKILNFVDVDDNHLFDALSSVLPRAGDTVRYSMEASDSWKWNPEAWKRHLDLGGKDWTVARVCHEFRRMSIERTVPVVMVVLKPNA